MVLPPLLCGSLRRGQRFGRFRGLILAVTVAFRGCDGELKFAAAR
jgi:hypothetical protein